MTSDSSSNTESTGAEAPAEAASDTDKALPPQPSPTLPDGFTFLPLDEQPSRLHRSRTADVVPAVEPLPVERHCQGEFLRAGFIDLDGC